MSPASIFATVVDLKQHPAHSRRRKGDMEESLLDLWAERRAEMALLLGRLSPGQALEVLRIVGSHVRRGVDLGPYLSGTIEGMAERR
jgi:hypothetical protein